MDSWPYHSTPTEEDFLPGRVVVVEDDPVQQKMLMKSIEELGPGWAAVGVGSAEECLSLLQMTTFSLALVDYVLPGGSGLDLVREFRKRGHVLATVLVTGHGSEEIAARALRLGVSEYLQKKEGYLREVPFVVSRIVAQHRRNLRKLSEHSRLRMELAQATHRSLLDSFAAPIVHDIKNPLSVIKTAAELVAKRADGPKGSIRELPPLITRSVERIQGLIDELLKFARQEAEERTSVNLGELLVDLSFAEAEALRLHNILLVRSVHAEGVVVRAGRKALEQVFHNLIANAAEALAKDHGGGIIHVELKQEGETALVSISDNGPGIPPEMFARLFTPYSTHGKVRGTGLGLSISAGVVREHGGDIQAENVPGSGARFTVRLPLERHGPVAAVLEDEERMHELIASQLGQMGIRAEIMSDGAELIEKLEHGRWDVLILDIRTPRVSGVDVLRAMAKARPDLVKRTMVLSGSIADRDVQEALGEFPVPCLPKPYGMEELTDMVRLLLRGRIETKS